MILNTIHERFKDEAIYSICKSGSYILVVIGFLENFIHPSFIKKDDKDVAVIKCDQLPKEKTAFLEDTVYVRQTASTKKLSSKEALEWKENRLSKI
jgi:hypothetical protein